MRISDWSSDVCSSDLGLPPIAGRVRGLPDQQFARLAIGHVVIIGIDDAEFDQRERPSAALELVLMLEIMLVGTKNGGRPARFGRPVKLHELAGHGRDGTLD